MPTRYVSNNDSILAKVLRWQLRKSSLSYPANIIYPVQPFLSSYLVMIKLSSSDTEISKKTENSLASFKDGLLVQIQKNPHFIQSKIVFYLALIPAATKLMHTVTQ